MGRIRYTFDDLGEVIEAFTEKLGLAKYALSVEDYGARSAVTARPSIRFVSFNNSFIFQQEVYR